MSQSLPSRTAIGCRVHAKAKLLTSDSKCRRMYGANWKTKCVSGTVTNVIHDMSSGRKRTFIEAKYELLDGLKTVTLHLVSVKIGEATGATPNMFGPIRSDHAGHVENQPPPNHTAENPVTVTAPSITASMSTEGVGTSNEGIGSGPASTEIKRIWQFQEVLCPLNGEPRSLPWKVIGPMHEMVSYGNGMPDMTAYDYFMWMFPQPHLSKMVRATSSRLERHGCRVTSAGEVLKFFGMLVLMTRFEFSSRKSLWSSTSCSKYIPSPNFGKMMPRKRYEDLHKHICFTECDPNADEEVRWNLIGSFVEAINDHRKCHVLPGETICVDESISRWYGLGGEWSDIGLPHYVALDRKPESGCELKTASCGKSGIMIKIEVTVGRKESRSRQFECEHLHGTAVLRRMVSPWEGSGRVVCADSFFSSVEAAETLFSRGLRYIGVIKNAYSNFPMKELSEVELPQKGQHVSMISTNGNCELMACMWVDRNRRYFVSSTGSTEAASPIYRERWHSENGLTYKRQIEIPIPKVCETYYATCSQIDRHNRCRQAELLLEKKCRVKNWALRVNTSLLGIIIVDAWKLYKGARGSMECMSPNQFYCELADQLIENKMDCIGRRKRSAHEDRHLSNDLVELSVGPNLVSTSRKRKAADGTASNAVHQSRCSFCPGKHKTKFVCNGCKNSLNKEVFVCHTDTGRQCYAKHFSKSHDASLAQWNQ